MATMKSVLIHGKPGPLRTEIVDVEIPTPGDDEVLIKIVVAGSNPKDWKLPTFMEMPPEHNTGDDMAGVVHAVGKNVVEFKAGDRVAAFHRMRTPAGSYAEYGIAPKTTTFHIPNNISFEEAATIPLAAGTAALGLYQPHYLGLPTPLAPLPPTQKLPLLIYGASSAVGAFAAKLAKLSNIGPIIGVCGAGAPYALRAGCDKVVDYRRGRVVEDVRAALASLAGDGGEEPLKLRHAFDAISEPDNVGLVDDVLELGGKHTLVLPTVELHQLRSHVVGSLTKVSDLHADGSGQDLGFALFRLFAKWLEEGRFEGHPVKVVPGGLLGVEPALVALREGRISAQKQVFRIKETPGLA